MRKYKDGLSRVARFTEAGKTRKKRKEKKVHVRNIHDIHLLETEIKKKQKTARDPDMQEKTSRDICAASAAPHPQLLLPTTLPALCDVCLCPLGATISPSNSFQLGIHTASPIPFSDSPKPGLLQRDRQLVRLGEVAFDVPGFAEASLFAHIKAEAI